MLCEDSGNGRDNWKVVDLVLLDGMQERLQGEPESHHDSLLPEGQHLHLGRVVTQLSFNRVVKVMVMPYMWNMGRRESTFIPEAALPNCGWRVWVRWDTTFRWERHTWVFEVILVYQSVTAFGRPVVPLEKGMRATVSKREEWVELVFKPSSAGEEASMEEKGIAELFGGPGPTRINFVPWKYQRQLDRVVLL